MALLKPHPTRETYRLDTLEWTPPEAVAVAALVAALYILLYLSPLRGGKVLPSSRCKPFSRRVCLEAFVKQKDSQLYLAPDAFSPTETRLR